MGAMVNDAYGYNLTNVKLHNRSLVYNVIRLNGPIKRASVARRTRLTRATITNIINEFIESGLVTCSEETNFNRSFLEINPTAFYICAVHLRGSTAKVTVVTPGMDLVDSTRVLLVGSPQEALAKVAQAVNEFNKHYDLKVMGVAVSGVVDAARGFLKYSATLGWENVCFVDNLQRLVDLPMVVERNANAPLLAEVWQGSAVGKRNVVYVNYGTGIGCGIMVNGQLVASAGIASGELGHTTVDPSGPFCHCGNAGCLEALVDLPALLQQCRAISDSFSDISEDEIEPLFNTLYAEAESGNESCHSLLMRTAQYIGMALANIVTLIAPEVIVLGNGFVSAGAPFIAMITDIVEKRVLRSSRGSFKIITTCLDTDAITIGISSLAIQQFFES